MLRRALVAVGLVVYVLMTLVCVASIAVAVVTESQEVMGLVGSALVVFYAGETVELARSLRRPSGKPALHPTWSVPCAVLGFVLGAGLADWVRGV